MTEPRSNPLVALAGQTVVVIGGSSGIGLETARRARAEGASVVLTGRNPDRLERAATSSAPRCPSGAWSGRPTSPRSPCT